MGRNRYKELCWVAVICALLLGCYQDEASIDMPQRGNTFTLSPQIVREVTVKSNSSFQDNIINGDVYVIQVDATGKVMTNSDGSLLVTAVSPTPSGENLYSVTLNNLTTPSKIYFMANIGSNPLSGKTTATEDDIKAASKGIGSEGNTISEESVIGNGVPMVGVWEEGEDFTEIPMIPSVAKVVFTLQTELGDNQEFALQSVQLKKVPNSLYYYRADSDPAKYATNNTVYYALSINYSDEASYNLSNWGEHWLPNITCTGKPMTAPETCTWYIPENAQGTTNITNQWEKNAENAPEGRGDFCTYVEIKGYYKYDGLINEVTYQVFLGENATNDYNLIRGTQYNVTATIKGQHTVDTRVTPMEPQNYIDYTDNRMPWFVVNTREVTARMDADLTQMIEDNNYEGNWIVPKKKDLMMEWIYQLRGDGITSFYWAEEALNDAGEIVAGNSGSAIVGRWSISMGDGRTIVQQSNTEDGGGTSGQSYYLRPVMDVSGYQYPYVTHSEEGRDIIVSRDNYGGAKNVRIPQGEDLWTTTPAHDEDSEKNTVAAQFEIAKIEDESLREKVVWSEAEDYCEKLGEGWRMPTQRELMLMYVMNDQLTNKLMETREDVENWEGDMGSGSGETDVHIFYWSATAESAVSGNAWSVCFCIDEDSKNGKTEGYTNTAANFVRCVRDVEWKNN